MVLGKPVTDFCDIADPFAETIDAELFVAGDDDPAARLNTRQKLRKPRFVASAVFSEQEQPTGITRVCGKPWLNLKAFLFQRKPIRSPRLQAG